MITSRQPSSLSPFTLKLTGNHHRTTCISSRPQLCGQVSKFKDKKKKIKKKSKGIIGRMECKDRNLETLIECGVSKIKGQKWLQTIFKFSFHFFPPSIRVKIIKETEKMQKKMLYYKIMNYKNTKMIKLYTRMK